MKLREMQPAFIDEDIIIASSPWRKRPNWTRDRIRHLRRSQTSPSCRRGPPRARAEGKRTIEELARLQPEVVFNLAFCSCPLEPSFAGALEVLGLPFTGSVLRALLHGE
jgi:hypothetical protein